MEASAFAAELLAPAKHVARLFTDGNDAAGIAEHFGVPEPFVWRRLVSSVLCGFVPTSVTRPGADATLCLDEAQTQAAQAADRAVVVTSGPGTGKTRTLVGRIAWLAGSGTAPERILAVTFSRNAAEELRVRLRGILGASAERVQVFTLHGFGLELLRRYGTGMGLPAEPHVADAVRAFALLERVVRTTDLGELSWPDWPYGPLPELAKMISRWKAVRLRPSDVLAMAAEQGTIRSAVLAYGAYEAQLRDLGLLDFDDLIERASDALDLVPAAAKCVASEIDHVLVDEMQDMDAGQLGLVRRLAATGASLWAVGDPLQSIYGFRGASADPTAAILDAGSGVAQVTLGTCYRCAPPVAEVLSRIAPLAGALNPVALRCVRAPTPGTLHAIQAANEPAQATAIAAEARNARACGVAWGAQAVLCRTNAQARAVATGLRLAGVPVAGPADALDGVIVLRAIRAVASGPGDGTTDTDPRGALTRLASVLFGSEGCARGVTGPGGAFDRIALAWLWDTAERSAANRSVSAGRPGAAPIEAWLSDLRRAKSLGCDRLECADGPGGADAVRVMTIHAAKGLEFDTVYIPYLNASKFPPRPRPSLVHETEGPSEGDSMADEARALYVAVSRAKRSVVALCCDRIGGRRSRPSDLWLPLQEALLACGGRVSGVEAMPEPVAPNVAGRVPDTPGRWSIRALDEYRRCPALFRFGRDAGPRTADVTPYGAFVRATREALRVLRDDGDVEGATRRYESLWTDAPVTADWSGYYRRKAAAIIAAAGGDVRMRGGEWYTSLALDLAHGCLTLRSDRSEATDGAGMTVEHFVFRPRRRSAPVPDQLAALKVAACRRWPEADVRVVLRYLPSGETEDAPATRDAGAGALRRYETAMEGIRYRRFAPRPGEHCAWCPYLFDCERTGDGPEA
jgi:superfamily I DNA/RNA helicase